jgi:hypothetical protein
VNKANWGHRTRRDRDTFRRGLPIRVSEIQRNDDCKTRQWSLVFREPVAESIPSARDIIGVRNILTHGYAELDHNKVYH